MRKDGRNKGSGALRVRPHSDNPAIYKTKRPEGLSASKKHQQIKDYANVTHRGGQIPFQAGSRTWQHQLCGPGFRVMKDTGVSTWVVESSSGKEH